MAKLEKVLRKIEMYKKVTAFGDEIARCNVLPIKKIGQEIASYAFGKQFDLLVESEELMHLYSK